MRACVLLSKFGDMCVKENHAQTSKMNAPHPKERAGTVQRVTSVHQTIWSRQTVLGHC